MRYSYEEYVEDTIKDTREINSSFYNSRYSRCTIRDDAQDIYMNRLLYRNSRYVECHFMTKDRLNKIVTGIVHDE